jgi:hypothetical protein
MVSSSSMSFSSKIFDDGQLQWSIFEHVVFQEWKNKIIKLLVQLGVKKNGHQSCDIFKNLI